MDKTSPDALEWMLETVKTGSNNFILLGIANSALMGLTDSSTEQKQAWQNLWQALSERAAISAAAFNAVITGLSATIDILDEQAAKTVEGIEPGHAPSAILDTLSRWTDRATTIILHLYPELLKQTDRQPQDRERKIIDLLSQRVRDRGIAYGVLVCNNEARPAPDAAEADAAEIETWRTQQAEIIKEEIKTATLNKLDWPLDMINKSVWDEITEIPQNAQGQLMFATQDPAFYTVFYGINFKDIEEQGVRITKCLTPYDKRVYTAVGALFCQHRRYPENVAIMSIGQIFAAMGNTGKPNASQRKKINDSLTKMRAATIFIDSTAENNKKTRFTYDSDLLPFERISAIVNGSQSESVIRLRQEPPMLAFARKRKQITTIPRRLLENGLRQTNDTLRLEDYLYTLIAAMKHPGSIISHDITLATLYERLKLKGTSAKHKMARQRLPEKVRYLLDHCKKTGYISSYTEEQDRFTIQP